MELCVEKRKIYQLKRQELLSVSGSPWKVPLLPQIWINTNPSLLGFIRFSTFLIQSHILSSQLLCNTMSHGIWTIFDYPSWILSVTFKQTSFFPQTQQTKDSNKLNFSESKDLVRFFTIICLKAPMKTNSKYKPCSTGLHATPNKIRLTSCPLSFICSSIMEYLFLFLPTKPKVLIYVQS